MAVELVTVNHRAHSRMIVLEGNLCNTQMIKISLELELFGL